MNDHRHQIANWNPPLLCECGAVWEPEQERWREPKAQKERS